MANILFVIDPLEKLDLRWDTTLSVIRVLIGRGHQIWICDVDDIQFKNHRLLASAEPIGALNGYEFKRGKIRLKSSDFFNLIVMRKEPPFNLNYLHASYLLDLAAKKTPVVNHPSGIRNANEKLSILNFPHLIPPTLVSNRTAEILAFRKKIRSDLVIKPLDQKGGYKVTLLKITDPHASKAVEELIGERAKFIMAQQFIRCRPYQSDKRILILDGKFLCAYEKRAPANDFRSNLGLGGTFHPTRLTPREKTIIRTLRPFLKSEGIQLAGLDVMSGYLIEINVTCPAGIPEAELLYPTLLPAAKWADSLESHLKI